MAGVSPGLPLGNAAPQHFRRIALSSTPLLRSISFAMASDAMTPNATNPISWQSIFWALVACGLNVLLQNAGTVCGLSSYDRMSLRSSPILSGVDASLILIKFIWLLSIGCTPKFAARHVWYDRFENPAPGSGIDRLWSVSMIAFILGALPQTVKIFAMQGIPLTQAFAAMFLTAFVLPEVLRVYAGTAHAVDLMPEPVPSVSRAKERFNHLQGVVVGVAATVHVMIYTWVLGKILPKWLFYYEVQKSWGMERVTTNFHMITLFMFCFLGEFALFAPLGLGVLFLAKFLWKRFKSYFPVSAVLALEGEQMLWVYALFSGLFIIVPFCFLGSWIISIIPIDLRDDHYIPFMAYSVALIFIIPSSLFALHALYRLSFIGPFSRSPRWLFGITGSVSEFWSLSSLVFNCVTAFLYYSHIYNSSGTNKPTWTDALG
jgi:hypothetical protein